MKRLLLSAVIAGLAASCGADATVPSTDEKTETVRVYFYQALVSPARPDGCAWDSPAGGASDEAECSRVSSSAIAALDDTIAHVASSASVRELVDLVQGDTFASLGRPEIAGSVGIRAEGQSQPNAPLAHYSFIAMLGGPEFADVPLDTVFHVSLSARDSTTGREQEIGEAIISQEALEHARQMQTATWIKTSEDFRANGTLAVMIAVVPSGSDADPSSERPVDDVPAPF